MTKTIVIDAGHGYGGTKPDSGAIGFSGSFESLNNVNTALILQKKLEAVGFKVLMTRTDDKTYPSWSERLAICNKGDLIISIHNNSFSDVNSNGYETLVSDKAPQETLDIVTAVHESIVKATKLRDRGIKKRNDLAVLNSTNPHAMLLELAFISNEAEEKLLKDTKWQEMIADTITNALCQYYNITKPTTTPATPTKQPVTHTVKVVEQTILSNNILVKGIKTVSIDNNTYIKIRDLEKLCPRVQIDYRNNTVVVNIN